MTYVLEGPKWGSPARGTTTSITWSFADLDLTLGLSADYSQYPAINGALSVAQREIIRSAFTTWAGITGLKFIERADSASNDIRVGSLLIDGSGPTLATTQYYYSGGQFLKGAIDFDTDALANPTTLYSVALHEIGHALGLAHSTNPSDVMYPYLSTQNSSGLTFDDISGARSLYSDGLTLQGTASDDVLSGGPLSDLIYGRQGADTIIAGEGNNIVVGGNDSSDGSDLITSGAGNDLVFGNGGNDTVISTGGDDIVVGGFGNDSISLGTGANIVYGNQGDDFISTGDGNNLIIGGRGNDFVQTGAGADTIWGSEGNDVLDGGRGPDRFIFDVGSGDDQIRNFSFSEGDRLDLLGQSFSVVSSGGNALLLLAGGGSIQLLGVAPGAFDPSFVV